MTVTNEPAGVTGLGTGAVVEFPFDFKARNIGEVKVGTIIGQSIVPVSTLDYTVDLDPDLDGGTVTFNVAPANGVEIYIYRQTPIDQLVDVSSQNRYDPKVVGDVWDKLTMIAQEMKAELDRAVKTAPGEDPDELILSLFQYKEAAEVAKTAALAAQAAAEASAAAALAKENSMVRQRGLWVTATAYTPSDQYSFNGELYGVLLAHTSTTVAADVGAGKVVKLVEKGAAGVGSGDMLKSENLAGLSDYAAARNTMGITTLLNAKQDGDADLTALAGLVMVGNALKHIRVNAAGDAYEAYTPPFTLQYAPADANVPANGASLSLTHGLGAVPKLVTVHLVCAVIDEGFAVNDVIEGDAYASGQNIDIELGVGWRANATTINLTVGNNGLVCIRQSDGFRRYLTSSSWRLRVRAYL